MRRESVALQSDLERLVHGVKPSLYEGFQTEAEAKDFVAHHRDHHEGAKQKSARKAREWARAESRAKHVRDFTDNDSSPCRGPGV